MADLDVIEVFVNEATGSEDVRRLSQLARALGQQLRVIDYAEDGYAERIRLPRFAPAYVVVDPLMAFGLPFVVSHGPRVEHVLDRFRAGDPPDSIALELGLSGSAVDAIIGSAGRRSTS